MLFINKEILPNLVATSKQYGTLCRSAVCTSIDWNQSIERQICLSIYWLSFDWL